MNKKYEILLSLPGKVSGSQFEIMKVLEKGEMEIEKIREKLGKSLSTVSKQISELEEKGYVIRSQTKPKNVN